jgi:hypothetical protein
MMESHLHNSMYVFHMCTFFSSPLGRSAQVVEKGHFVFVYVISTKLLPCFGYLVFCSKIPYSVIRIIIVKFLYKSKLIDLIKIHASLHTQTTWLQVRLPFFFLKKKKKKKKKLTWKCLEQAQWTLGTWSRCHIISQRFEDFVERKEKKQCEKSLHQW